MTGCFYFRNSSRGAKCGREEGGESITSGCDNTKESETEDSK